MPTTRPSQPLPAVPGPVTRPAVPTTAQTRTATHITRTDDAAWDSLRQVYVARCQDCDWTATTRNTRDLTAARLAHEEASGTVTPPDAIERCPYCDSRNVAELDPDEAECHDCGDTFDR